MKCEGLTPDPWWSMMESGIYFLTWQEGLILSAHVMSSSSYILSTGAFVQTKMHSSPVLQKLHPDRVISYRK